MKKRLIILATILCLGGIGCGSSSTSDSTQNTGSATSTDSTSSTDSAKDSARQEAEGEKELEETADSASDKGATAASTPDIPVSSEDVPLEECLELPDYKGLKLQRTVLEVTDDDINSQIYADLQKYAEPVTDGAVEDRDIVVVDFECKVDGKKIDNESANDFETIVGENYFPGDVEKDMIGMKPGESKDIEYTFESDYHDPDVAGKKAVYTIKINELKRPAKEISDEWVQKNSKSKTVDEYKKEVKKKLEKENEAVSQEKLGDAAWEQVQNGAKVKTILQKYIDEGKELYKIMLKSYAEARNMTYDEYVKSSGMTEERLEKDSERYAKEMAVNFEIMDLIAKKEGIDPKGEEVESQLEEMMKSSGFDNREEFYDKYGESYAKMVALSKVLSKCIVSYANVTDSASSAADPESQPPDSAQ